MLFRSKLVDSGSAASLILYRPPFRVCPAGVAARARNRVRHRALALSPPLCLDDDEREQDGVQQVCGAYTDIDPHECPFRLVAVMRLGGDCLQFIVNQLGEEEAYTINCESVSLTNYLRVLWRARTSSSEERSFVLQWYASELSGATNVHVLHNRQV